MKPYAPELPGFPTQTLLTLVRLRSRKAGLILFGYGLVKLCRFGDFEELVS